MKGKNTGKIYYYHDPKHDDFAATKIKTVVLPDDYSYVPENIFYKLGEMLVRFIAFPIIFLILKLLYLQRVRNRKVLKTAGKNGAFLYANHTDYMLDAYNPSVLSFPRHAHILVNPDAVSIPGLGTVVKMLGAVPIPTSMRGMCRFKESVKKLIEKRRFIVIYPEAHIWPFYTDIRPFGTESFHYPAELGTPCYTFTNIHTKRKCSFIRLPKVVTYFDGPFYPDMSLPMGERKKKLRDEVYSAMKKRVNENPHYCYTEYVYVDDESKTNRKQ